MNLQLNDKVRVTWLIHGEAVLDRKGNVMRRPPCAHQVSGWIYYLGPELPNGRSATVAKCRAETGALFNFYPDSTLDSQKVEVVT